MIDPTAATDLLMRFLAVEGVTGQEKDIAREIQAALKEAGVPARNIRFDDANTRIPLPTQTGNLIVNLPGTAPGPRLLFMTHLDTVPLCAGAVPVRKGNRIVPKGETALGGDNRTGCAVLVTLAATLLKHEAAAPAADAAVHRPRGERPVRGPAPRPGGPGRAGDGVQLRRPVGARHHDRGGRGGPVGGGDPRQGVARRRVPGARASRRRWSRPWRMAEVYAGGWFGKVVKDGREGTSNVGPFGDADGRSAGDATNVVTDYVHIKGESRSHDPKFVREITAAYKEAFAERGRPR